MASEGKKFKIVDGPSKWDLMLALFDCQPRLDSIPTRFISFAYLDANDRRRDFCMFVTSVERRREGLDDDLLELPCQLWSIGGYINSPDYVVHVVDYSVLKRAGWTDLT